MSCTLCGSLHPSVCHFIKPSSNYPNVDRPPVFLLGPAQHKCLPDCSVKRLLTSPAEFRGRMGLGKTGQVVLRESHITWSCHQTGASTCEPLGGSASLCSQSSEVTTSAPGSQRRGPAPIRYRGISVEKALEGFCIHW